MLRETVEGAGPMRDQSTVQDWNSDYHLSIMMLTAPELAGGEAVNAVDALTNGGL